MQRLYKSRSNKVLDGVCGGIATYFNVDAVLIRVIWILVSIIIGQLFFGVIAYLIAMVIMPVEPASTRVRNVDKKRTESGVQHGLQVNSVGNESQQDSQDGSDLAEELLQDDRVKEGETNQSEPSEPDELEPDDHVFKDNKPVEKNRSGSSIASILGLLLIALGAAMIVENFYDFNIWRWIQLSMDYVWPSILIVIGLFLLFRRK